jgi:hypothetical protein
MVGEGVRAEPRSSMLPTPSWPRMCEEWCAPRRPVARPMSVPQMPEWVSRTRISVGPGRGMSKLARWKE